MTEPSGTPRLMRLLLVVLATAFVLLFGANSLTRFRSYSPDSMNYVDVARNVLAGDGLVQSAIGYNHPRFLGAGRWPDPFVAQPPGYPLAIAALGGVGIEPADGALLWPVLALAVILLLAPRLADRFGGPAATALVLAALPWFTPLTDACRRAWSDGLAAALVLGGLLLLSKGDAGARRRWLLLGALCGLAFATRYALVSFCCFAGGFLLWQARRSPRGALIAAAWLALGAAPFIAPVLAHNLWAAGHLLPTHNASTLGLGELVRSTRAVVLSYTDLLDPRLRVLGLVALLLGGLLLNRRAPRADRPAGLGLLAAWAGVYIAFVVWQRWRIHFDELAPRLLLPALLPAVIALAAWLGRALPRTLRPAATGLALVSLGLAAGRETLIARQRESVQLAERIGYSPRLVVVRDRTTPEDVVIGNDPLDVAFYLRRTRLISFSPQPYTDAPDYAALIAFLDRHGDRYRRAYIVVRDFSRGDEARIRESFGPFIADLLTGRFDDYPRIRSIGVLGDTHLLEVRRADGGGD